LRLINQTEINKLAKLNLEGDEITISGSVNANQVKELYDTVVNIVKGSTTDLDPDTDGDQLGLGIEKGAQVNKIEAIGLPDAVLAIANKEVTIPAFVAGKYGVIKGAELVNDKAVANKVYANDGVGEVKAISTDILVQGDFELILNGGNASLK
jgi:fructose-1-phosphate kinase PfkB-like protein